MTRREAFEAWLQRPGDCKTVIYHKGRLPADRMVDPVLDRLATSVLDAASRGKIALVQRRVSGGRYEYVARHLSVAA